MVIKKNEVKGVMSKVLNAIKFLDENREVIIKNYVSSCMVWGIDLVNPAVIYACGYDDYYEKTYECLFLSLHEPPRINQDDIAVGLVFACFENNRWTLNELDQYESGHLCDECRERIKIGDLRCSECDDYDICLSCFENKGHEHDVYGAYIGTWGLNTFDSDRCSLVEKLKK